jgi:hypothetical protein
MAMGGVLALVDSSAIALSLRRDPICGLNGFDN